MHIIVDLIESAFHGRLFEVSDSRKAYRVSLRHKLSKNYAQQVSGTSYVNRRWVNGFMAAGYHSGLITLQELRIECLSAYRSVFKKRMTEAQERQLELRLCKLCVED